MEGEMDRRHGTYHPRDVVPLDTAPSEVEASPSGTIGAVCSPKATDHPDRELVVSGCISASVQSCSQFANREQPCKSDSARRNIQLEVSDCDLKPNILRDALACTQGDRQAAYGSPAENWNRTVLIFNAMTGRDLTTDEGVKFAIAMKLARLQKTPNHRDSMVDLAGYAWVLSEVPK